MRPRVLVACEFSGTVRDAFRAHGCDAWSCDFEPCEADSCWHIQGDVLPILGDGWDMMVAHPPCERLCVSGARWRYEKPGWVEEQEASLGFVRALMDAPIARIALENPVGIISSRIRKPDQVIQPWMFGVPETKATCLWLKNLPLLQRTHYEADLFAPPPPLERRARVHKLPPSPDRKRLRAWRYAAIASAMAAQWAPLLPTHPRTDDA